MYLVLDKSNKPFFFLLYFGILRPVKQTVLDYGTVVFANPLSLFFVAGIWVRIG